MTLPPIYVYAWQHICHGDTFAMATHLPWRHICHACIYLPVLWGLVQCIDCCQRFKSKKMCLRVYSWFCRNIIYTTFVCVYTCVWAHACIVCAPLLPLFFLALVSPRRCAESVAAQVLVCHSASGSVRQGTGGQHTGQIHRLLDGWDQGGVLWSSDG